MPSNTERLGWNNQVIEEFRSNAGRVGGQFEGAPLLLLHTVGAKSGDPRINPMMYLADGDRLFVFASNGGRDSNPGWFYNVLAHPDVEVEVGTDRFQAVATPLRDADRDRVFAKQAELYPGFKDYEKQTARTIPVVALDRAG
jgi:deazaflavin-dependent oxidoreductase (nitroreductase family)